MITITAMIVGIVSAWVFSQLLMKPFIIAFVKKQKRFFSAMMLEGHMPSSHTALVASLATAVGLREGFLSTPFFISAVLAVLIIHRTTQTERAIGEFMTLVKHHFKGEKLEADIGHNMFEVFVGLVIGIVFVIAASYLF
jgi:acid phosphatase family membrane protein YuiD